MSQANPFTPSFGTNPPVLVGRGVEVAQAVDALRSGVGDPFRAVKVTGLRGSGKTVYLNRVEDAARQLGWHVISETARPGLVERVTSVVLPRILSEVDPDSVERRITGMGASFAGAGLEASSSHDHRYKTVDDFRSLLSRLADLADEASAGVLVTVDEMNVGAGDDLRELTQAIQHCFREGRQVAFFGAGLHSEVQDLLDLPGMTFLRRAEEVQFGRVDDDEVRRGLLDPISQWGKRISADALAEAVAGTRGYPYMIQVIGHRMWNLSEPGDSIDLEVARQACEQSLRRVGDLVLAPELRPLSENDQLYLRAMAVDDGPSRTGEIAQRLGVDASYAGVYRNRLLKAGVIEAVGHGRVDFTLAAMRDYLRSLDSDPQSSMHEAVSRGEEQSAPQVPPDGRRNPGPPSR